MRISNFISGCRLFPALLCLLIAPAALAAEPTPGSACSTAGAVVRTGGPETSGVGNVMVCQGGTWKSALGFDASAQVTKIGNLTCASGEVLEFDGTKWMCGTDGGADNLGNHTATTNINLGANYISRAGTAAGLSFDASNNATLSADLTISGNDIVMGTNTAGYLLIGDGTNYTPTAVSGDITITGAGVTAIGADKVTEAMLKAVNAATDEYCLTYETTTGDFEWQTCGSGGDNLGNHTATTNINLGANYISRAGTAAGLSLDASNNATFSGDLTITGDDLFMATNTAGHVLIADGTNFNPTAVSGDITVTGAGVTAIGADKVTEAMLKSVNAPTDEYCLTYETTTGDFEWQSCGGGGGSAALSGLTAATATNTLANANYGQTWNWDTLTTGTAMTFASTSMTTGKLLELTNSNMAASAGTVLKVNNLQSGAGFGIDAQSWTTTLDGAAIRGLVLGTSGKTYGVYGVSASSAGFGGYFANLGGGYAAAFMGGNVGVGTSLPGSLLHVGTGGYAQFEKTFAGAPTGTDCDAAAELGRVTVDTTNGRWYVCTGTGGWKYTDIGTSGGGGGATLNGITAATANQAGIANAAYTIVWNWDTLAGGSALKLASTSTAAASNAQKLFEVSLSGANSTAGQSTFGIYANNTHTGATSINYGIYGAASGGTTGNYAVYGQSSATNGTGVLGWASAVSGTTYGVFGSVDSPSGFGVYGTTTASGGVGVKGVANGGAASGVVGTTTSTSNNATGVYGAATGATGATYGVYGLSSSSTGTGVYGTGVFRGVSGVTSSASNGVMGVYGGATDVNGMNYGVYGLSASGNGTGGYFTNTSVGYALITGTGNVGIGEATPDSLLHVGTGGYAQFEKTFAGAPTGTDCDAAAELGRITVDTTNGRWYVCTGTGGWKYATIGTSGGAGDNLGNHTATQNIVLGSNYLSGDGGNEGIVVDSNGKASVINPAGYGWLGVFGTGSDPYSGIGLYDGGSSKAWVVNHNNDGTLAFDHTTDGSTWSNAFGVKADNSAYIWNNSTSWGPGWLSIGGTNAGDDQYAGVGFYDSASSKRWSIDFRDATVNDALSFFYSPDGVSWENPLNLRTSGNVGFDAGGYLNFGSTDGTTGYGFRDNAGTIEVKNSGGSWTPLGGLTAMTAVNSTSGTSINFTGIPAGVKRITISFQGVSTNGNSGLMVQLGDSGGIETTGYLGSVSNTTGGGTALYNTTTGLCVDANGAGTLAGSTVRHGVVVITNITGNSWTSSCSIGFSDSSTIESGGSSKTLSATLDRVRITTVGGTNTFDAGVINVMYE